MNYLERELALMDFLIEEYRLIFQTLKDIHGEGNPINAISLIKNMG